MMRIIYVTPYDSSYTSIFSHTKTRIDHWEAAGSEVKVSVLGRAGRQSRSSVLNLWFDLRMISDVVLQIREFQPDVIYFRWLFPVPGLIKRLSRLAPVVIDVHSDDVAENVMGSRLRRMYSFLFRNRELSSASGGVFVTDELAASKAFQGLAGPRAVFPNGSNLARRNSAPSHSVPRVGMSVGGVLPWTGIDIFSQLADTLEQFHFVIVAPQGIRAELTEAASSNVELIFTQNQNEYLKELESWTVGFGTLALHRKGMKIAAPLKVRDYIALGIPTILTYQDQTLSRPEYAEEMILQMPTMAESAAELDITKLAEFIDSARGQQVSVEASKAVAIREIELGRIQFLERFSSIL